MKKFKAWAVVSKKGVVPTFSSYLFESGILRIFKDQKSADLCIKRAMFSVNHHVQEVEIREVKSKKRGKRWAI